MSSATILQIFNERSVKNAVDLEIRFPKYQIIYGYISLYISKYLEELFKHKWQFLIIFLFMETSKSCKIYLNDVSVIQLV